MLLCAIVLNGCANLGGESARAQNVEAAAGAVVLAEADKLRSVGATILKEQPSLGLAAAWVSNAQMEGLANKSKNCGPYKFLAKSAADSWPVIDRAFDVLLKNRDLNLSAAARTKSAGADTNCGNPNPDIVAVLASMSGQGVWDDASAFSEPYESRLHTLSDPNAQVRDLIDRLRAIAGAPGLQIVIEPLGPGPNGPGWGTQQLSVRARIIGATRPAEYVVVGAHLDSVSDSAKAPGANDNASGAAVVLAAYRALLSQRAPPARTVDFIWYGAEEVAPGRSVGLIGSEFLAKKYKWEDRYDVVGVLNFDMTMGPGAENGAIAIEPDYTNFQLRKYMSDLNCAYVGAKVVDYRCGYPCSDHASWDAQKFAAAHITETAKYDAAHTAADRMDGLNAEQGLLFAKLAAAFVLDLSNKTWRPEVARD